MAQRPVTLADIVRGHVSLEIEGFDRLYFNGWVAALQTPGQVAGWLRWRGFPIASPAVLGRNAQAFRAAVRRYADGNQVPWVVFRKGDRKLEVVRPYLDAAEKAGRSQVVAVGEAREFQWVFDAAKKAGPDGVPWFRFYRTERLVTCYYFYIHDRRMGLRRYFARLAMITALLGGAVASIATTSPAASAAIPAPATVGYVRCANLSPGTPAVDIYLYAFGNPAHPTVLRHASYGDVSSYMPVSPGEYTVAMRPVGAAASSPPVVSTTFMVSAGAADYTVASIGPAAARRLEVLQDQMAAPEGSALIRVIQASLKEHLVTVRDGRDVLAQQLAFGSVTSYMTVRPGTQTVQFSAPGENAAMSVTLAAGSVHTIVVLDGSSGLKVDNLTDAAGSQVAPMGGAATGLGGTAPHDTVPDLAPWLATLAAGLLLVTAGVVRLRRSRRTATVMHE
jgi:Domain of unknown function (DUF4397)